MIPFSKTNFPDTVSEEKMQKIYGMLKTPYKYGAVCRRDGEYTDSPSVFRLGSKWYMMHLIISDRCDISGYSTWLSESDDLLSWTPVKEIMARSSEERFDAKQVAGYLALADIDWNSTNTPGKIGEDYLVSYLGGNLNGYEPAPLYIGLAKTTDLTDPEAYRRNDTPLFSPYDADCRDGEKRTMFRSFIFEDKAKVTGHPYVMAYNAKSDNSPERIFLAVSDDALHWEHYGDGPVLDGSVNNPNTKITADAQILKIGDIYVMIYFNYDYDKSAYSNFACSYDLVHWTVWKGEPLIKSELPWEDVHAHKSWIVRHGGITYNYYCAVNSKNERFIALATSEPVK